MIEKLDMYKRGLNSFDMIEKVNEIIDVINTKNSDDKESPITGVMNTIKISKEDAIKLATAAIVWDCCDIQREYYVREIMVGWERRGYIEGIDAVKSSEDCCESKNGKWLRLQEHLDKNYEFFEKWFEENELRFHHAQYSDKQIAYSAFCAAIDFNRSNK